LIILRTHPSSGPFKTNSDHKYKASASEVDIAPLRFSAAPYTNNQKRITQDQMLIASLEADSGHAQGVRA
jgi:hypothetical protein